MLSAARVPSRRRGERKGGEGSRKNTFKKVGSAGTPETPGNSRDRTRARGEVNSLTSEEALNREEDGADIVHGGPLLLEDVQTNVAKLVHVWMEARRLKLHCGRLQTRSVGLSFHTHTYTTF